MTGDDGLNVIDDAFRRERLRDADQSELLLSLIDKVEAIYSKVEHLERAQTPRKVDLLEKRVESLERRHERREANLNKLVWTLIAAAFLGAGGTIAGLVTIGFQHTMQQQQTP